MTTVLHTWLYGRFIVIQSNLRRKKLQRTNQGSNFLGGTFSNRDNVRAPIQLRRESQPQHLKRWLFLKYRPIHFHNSTTSVISRSNETSWVFLALKPTSHFQPQSTVPRWSDSCSEANSSYCHIRCLITLRVESSIISTDSNVTDNIIRKVINK